MQAGGDVQVIIHTIDAIEVALPIFDNAPNIAEKILAPFHQEHGPSVLRGKYDVIADCGVGGHASDFTPFPVVGQVNPVRG